MEFVCLKRKELDKLFNEITELKNLVIDVQKKQISEQWVESRDVPDLLGVSHKTWQKFRDDRKIPFTQFGAKIRVKLGDIDKFLNDHSITKR